MMYLRVIRIWGHGGTLFLKSYILLYTVLRCKVFYNKWVYFKYHNILK